ncbi:MAG TPA: M17 family peptidase N-terminal domain-containing protein, partial [Candidatus Caenarcaniphilales bacterium]
MDIRGTDTLPLNWTGDGLAISFFEDAVELTEPLTELDTKLAGALKELIADAEFKGKAGTSAVTRVGGNSLIRKVMVVGLGKPEALKLDSLRRVAAVIARLAKREKCKTLGIHVPRWNDNPALTAQAIAEGIELALHQDLRFRSEPEETHSNPIERVELLGLGDQSPAIAQAHQICTGVLLARELVAAPANIVTPITLAETAAAIAQDYGLNLELLEKEDCEKLGMGAFLGVAQASDLPPKFIHLTYKPTETPRRKLAIIGKGLTFDSGGLNI